MPYMKCIVSDAQVSTHVAVLLPSPGADVSRVRSQPEHLAQERNEIQCTVTIHDALGITSAGCGLSVSGCTSQQASTWAVGTWRQRPL